VRFDTVVENEMIERLYSSHPTTCPPHKQTGMHRTEEEITTGGVVFVEITNACNYSCNHCYLGELPNFGGDRTQLDKIYRALDDSLASFAINEVRFTGGEPMLAASLAPMIYLCRSRGLSYTVVSNGSGFRAQNWAAIRAYPPRLVWMSLYGCDEHLHERMTAKVGSFDRLIVTMHRLRQVDIRCGVHLIVWPPLVGHIGKQLDFAFSELQAMEVKCIPVQPAGAANRSSERLVMNVEELRSAREEVFTWCNANFGKRVRVAGRLAQQDGEGLGCMFRQRVFLTINHLGMASPCCLLMHDEPWSFNKPHEALTAATKVNGHALPCANGEAGVCPLLLADGSIAPR
jgi:MoaA/NifB/PqqE/SkfB family radical SAM enzyme